MKPAGYAAAGAEFHVPSYTLSGGVKEPVGRLLHFEFGARKKSRPPSAEVKAFEAGRATNARGLSAVRDVLEVRWVGRRGEALINWIGADPVTSMAWEPSWERISGITPVELRRETARRLPMREVRKAARPLPPKGQGTRHSRRLREEAEWRLEALENDKRARGSEEAAAAAGGAGEGAAAGTAEASREGGTGPGEPQGSEPGAGSDSVVEEEREESYKVEEVLRWRETETKREALVKWAGADEDGLPWKRNQIFLIEGSHTLTSDE